MDHSSQLKIYKRRNPQTTSLWKLLNCHFVDYEACYDKLFQQKYGFYRSLIELFRAHVLKMLKKEGLIDDPFSKMIMKWRHTSGFKGLKTCLST